MSNQLTIDLIQSHISSGKFKAVKAIKTCSVHCRIAIPGESVTTLVDNGQFIETVNRAPIYGNFVVLSNLLINASGTPIKNQYILSKEKFEKMYRRIDTTDTYRPISGTKTVYIVDENISFRAPWGATFNLQCGGVLVRDREGFYGINPLEFQSTYSSSKNIEEPILMPDGTCMSSDLISFFSS